HCQELCSCPNSQVAPVVRVTLPLAGSANLVVSCVPNTQSAPHRSRLHRAPSHGSVPMLRSPAPEPRRRPGRQVRSACRRRRSLTESTPPLHTTSKRWVLSTLFPDPDFPQRVPAVRLLPGDRQLHLRLFRLR